MQVTTESSPQSAFPVNTLGETETSASGEVVDTGAESTEIQVAEGEDGEAQAREREAENEALRFGWVPREEWRGPAERWRPASEFLEVRENVRKIASEENSQLRAKLAALEQREALRANQEREARERITHDSLQSELSVAYENQDWPKVRELTDKLLEHKVQKVAAPKPPAIDPAIVDSANRFKQANSWVESDKVLGSNFALELKNIVDLKLTDSFDEALKLAKERTQRLYPDRFRTRGNGSRHSIADTGGNPGSTGGKTWSDLLPTYREQAERDIEAKRYTKQEYWDNVKNDPDYFRR